MASKEIGTSYLRTFHGKNSIIKYGRYGSCEKEAQESIRKIEFYDNRCGKIG